MSHSAANPDSSREEDLDVLIAEDAAEEIHGGEDDQDHDVPMDSGDDDDDDDDDQGPDDEDEEIVLVNDSIAYFDQPPDSLFAIAQNPTRPHLVAVGGSAGAADDAPGAGWILNTSHVPSRPVLPPSFASDPSSASTSPPPVALDPLSSLDGHADSVIALCWTLPAGDVLVSGGLDGRMRAWAVGGSAQDIQVKALDGVQEVDEINWLAPCPCPSSPSSSSAPRQQQQQPAPNTVALGASDGSVWVYTIDPSDDANPFQIVQSYFLHTGACTAGAWTPDGRLLATVSEDGTLHVWDVWGLGATGGGGGGGGSSQTVVSIGPEDQRFQVEGGLYSVVVDPRAAFVAVGGAGGVIKIVSLPRLGGTSSSKSRNNPGRGAADTAAPGGQILASLHNQSDGVETLDAVLLAHTTPPTVLLAAGSVDGSVCVYDATRRFAARRHVVGAHGEHSVVKVEFVPGEWALTSCGMDGVVRRWDLRGSGGGGGEAAGGLVREWRGHRGGGEGGGVLGFVQGQTGERVVTAGDDGIALVFEA